LSNIKSWRCFCNQLHPGFWLENTEMPEPVVIPLICSTDCKHLLRENPLINSLVRYILNSYWLIQPKFRIRKCGIAETAVIQSIESMDWKHLLSGIVLIKSLVRYMRNFYWLIPSNYILTTCIIMV
jgi:hypothetical protein